MLPVPPHVHHMDSDIGTSPQDLTFLSCLMPCSSVALTYAIVPGEPQPLVDYTGLIPYPPPPFSPPVPAPPPGTAFVSGSLTLQGMSLGQVRTTRGVHHVLIAGTSVAVGRDRCGEGLPCSTYVDTQMLCVKLVALTLQHKARGASQ
jgi:hypothetical protein